MDECEGCEDEEVDDHGRAVESFVYHGNRTVKIGLLLRAVDIIHQQREFSHFTPNMHVLICVLKCT